jgi:hypothetical protein
VDLGAGWIDALEAVADRSGPAVGEVALVEFPVRLGVRQQEEVGDLLREFQLITIGDAVGRDTTTPHALLMFARAVTEQYADALAAPQTQLERAFAAGEEHTTLCYPLLPESRTVLLYYARTMEAADAYSREARLMTLPPTPELYALRRWTVEEFVRQYDGHPPRPWPSARTDLA